MGREAKFRKYLSMPGMLAEARRCFERVEDRVPGRGLNLADCLMSGLAVFSLKYPSLLKFEQDARGLGDGSDGTRRENLRTLFGIERAPSDARLRERLDELDPRELRRPFKRLFGLAQRGGVLKDFEWLGGRHLLSVDGTGHFSSPTVHCANCCVKERADGGVEYYHQSLCAVLVHPKRREVLPVVPPEPILRQDGATKNDCERNAAKRLLTDLRREHPHLPLLVVEDGLASNGPHVRLLKELGMGFLLGAKQGDHAALFRVGGRTGVGAAGAGRGARGGALGGQGRRRRGAPLPVVERGAAERRQRGPGGELPRIPGKEAERQGETLLVGHGPAGGQMERNGPDARRAGALADRERNVQHPEEPRLRVRAQLRPRQEAPGDGVRRADAAGVRHRPAAEGMLPAVPGGAGQGDAPGLLWETFRGMFLNLVVRDWQTLYEAMAFGHRTELVPFDTS